MGRADAVDATLGRGGDLLEGVADQVGQLHPLEAGPVGASYSVTSCDLRILMDHPTESISSHDPPSRRDDRWFGGPQR